MAGMNEPLHFRSIGALALRHWRLFTVVAVLAAVVSTVLSGPLFIKPRYRSRAVVYPVNLNSYSIETQSDQLMQLLESNSIRDSLIARFGLAAHYAVDTTWRGARAALYNLYNERVSIQKTRYESVELEVTDEDPALARAMVLEVLAQTDGLARRLQRHTSAELLEVVRLGLHNTGQRMDTIEGRLNRLRQTEGLLDYTAQTKEYSKGYVRALASGGRQPQEITAGLKALEDHGGEFLRLSMLNKALVKDYAKLQGQERQLALDTSKVLTYTNVVVQPDVPDKKVYPVRWLIVLASVVAAVLLCYVLVFLRGTAPGAEGQR